MTTKDEPKQNDKNPKPNQKNTEDPDLIPPSDPPKNIFGPKYANVKAFDSKPLERKTSDK